MSGSTTTNGGTSTTSGAATTVNGAMVSLTALNAGGVTSVFNNFFNANQTVTLLSQSGVSTVSGAAAVTTPQTAYTVYGASAVTDTTSGSDRIVVRNANTTVFAAPADTVSATGASTVFGASQGQTTVFVTGNKASVVGSSGSIGIRASGSNSTLIGGTATSLITVTGSNNLVVAGQNGVTGVDLTQTTENEMVATNPLGNSGTLVAELGFGAETVVGGSGASTVTANAFAPDAFIFVKGHAGGSETIFNFSANSNLGFAGYTTLPSETVGPYGDVMTLSDGTQVTFVGLFHKLF